MLLHGSWENAIDSLVPIARVRARPSDLDDVVHLHLLLVSEPLAALGALPLKFVDCFPLFSATLEYLAARQTKSFFSAVPNYR